jgi:hypothetical protein
MNSLPNIIRVIKSVRMRWAGHVARMGDKSGEDRFWVENSDGKSPVGRPRRIWKDDIKMNLLNVAWGGMYRIEVPQRRESWWAIVNAGMHVRISRNNTQSTAPHKAHLDPSYTTTQGMSSHQAHHHRRQNSTHGTPPHKARHYIKHTPKQDTPQPKSYHCTKF